MQSTRVCSWLAMAVMLLAVPSMAVAAPGAPRPEFGFGGVAPFTFGLAGSQRIGRIVATPTGIVVVGSVEGELVQARLSDSGSLDVTYPNGPLKFPSGGQLTPVPFGPADAALRPGGGIAITAYGFDLFFFRPDRAVLYELTPAGFIEFGFQSVVGLLGGPTGATSGAIAIQEDGREVVIGTVSDGPALRMVIVRQSRDTNLDPSFGINGFAELGAEISGAKSGRALTLQPDGKIVAVGALATSGSTSTVLVVGRFTSSGGIDTSFAGDGLQMVEVPPVSIFGYVNVHLLPGGRILVATSNTIVALTATGEPDVGFATAGTLTPAGPIVHTVTSPLGDLYVLTDAAVTAYTSDGQVNTTFGNGGVATLQRAGATAMALHPGGDLLVGSPEGAGVVVERIEGRQIFRLSIADAEIVEGGSGDRTITAVVTLDRPSDGPVSAAWATSPITATAGSDYRSASGVVSLAPGQTSATIQAAVVGDILGEADETFRITLSSAVGAVIADGTAIVTIRNDDDRIPPVIQSKNNVVAEAKVSPVPVVYTSPLATDNLTPAVTVNCQPRSGALFPLGTTPVKCIATDGNGNTAGSTFNVIVRTPTTSGAVTNPGNLNRELSRAAPGQRVRVTAGGFAARSKVRLVFLASNGNTTLLEIVRAEADGRIDARLKIPKTAPRGSAQIVAIGDSGNGELVRVWELVITRH